MLIRKSDLEGQEASLAFAPPTWALQGKVFAEILEVEVIHVKGLVGLVFAGLLPVGIPLILWDLFSGTIGLPMLEVSSRHHRALVFLSRRLLAMIGCSSCLGRTHQSSPLSRDLTFDPILDVILVASMTTLDALEGEASHRQVADLALKRQPLLRNMALVWMTFAAI